jgi:ribonuclease VapC
LARAVFDASAVVAVLGDEPGAALLGGYLGDALVSAVNLQEVVTILLRRGTALDAASRMIAGLRLEIRAHGATDAYAAAELHAATKVFGAGLGDRSCMALAISEGLPAVTTDKAWAKLAIPGLKVILAR